MLTGKVNNIFSLESEQFLISSLLLLNSSWNKIYKFITIDDFYFKNHKIIFSIILEFLNFNIYFDCNIIYEKLKFHDYFDYFKYLNFLSQKLSNPKNIYIYACNVFNMSIMRHFIKGVNKIIFYILNIKNLNFEKFLKKIESFIFNLGKRYFKEIDDSNTILIKSFFNNVLSDLKKKNYKNTNNIFTGFKDLDKILFGFCKGDLIIIAGRPSMGKTAFSINIAKNVANKNKFPLIIFSMEMTGFQLAIRMLSNITNINQNKFKKLNFSKKKIKFIENKINKNYIERIFVSESINLTISEIYCKCKILIEEFGDISIIIIDYLQLMKSSYYSYNRVLEVSDISRSLKCLARELNIPIIAVSQLNRSLETRNNKRPIISDLRESGSIEQDADTIIFIYRDEIYNDNLKNKGLAEIIVGKQRNGPTGWVNLNFIDKKLKFKDFN